jgi:hypothetical protein
MPVKKLLSRIFSCLLLLNFWCLSGCSAILEKKTQHLADSFSSAVLDSDDPLMIEQGIPPYLLLLDALVKNNPEQTALWQAAANLNSAYASSFIKDTARIKIINNKALGYAFMALCQKDLRLCHPRDLTVDNLNVILKQLDVQSVSTLYVAGSVWASWIQANSDDWNAIADMPRVEALMQRVVSLDEHYQQGAAHLYLGVLATVLTPALGGRPEIGKQHFERVIALSQGKNLMAKLYYAKNYARGILDRELHDKLLNEILAADPHAPNLTLSNIMAQQQAQQLLQSADDYF